MTTINLSSKVFKIQLIILAFISFLFSSCNKGFSNEDAKSLILQSLSLPQQFTKSLDLFNAAHANERIIQLQSDGFLNIVEHDAGSNVYIEAIDATEKSKPYVISIKNGNNNRPKEITFKTYDIDFGEITGISLNGEKDEATVRFSLKATNITPIGRILFPETMNSYDGELVFKKFDSGWQLKSEQDRNSRDLLQEIIERKRHNN